jgi:dTDP-glucose pyrophosphorylase
VFCAHPVIEQDSVVIGLPDTVWFPQTALADLPDDTLSFLLFPVDRPEFFDAVVLSGDRVQEIQVKRADAQSNWIWGAFKMPGSVFASLRNLWQRRQNCDEYFGTLINAYLAGGGSALGIKGGQAYVDVGTLHGYRAVIRLLSENASADADGTTLPAAHSIADHRLSRIWTP